jgi:hypothetical protein
MAKNGGHPPGGGGALENGSEQAGQSAMPDPPPDRNGKGGLAKPNPGLAVGPIKISAYPLKSNAEARK